MAAMNQVALRQRISLLPRELRNEISANTTSVRRAESIRLDASRDPSRNPSIAPANGTCPFLVLPPEIRRQIFSSVLPHADNGKPIMPSNASKQSSVVRNIMLVNRILCEEVSFMLYEERTFGLVLYEGLLDGGIEFLNSGRQRLQYRKHFTQVRFKRFGGGNGAFDFSRIRRLVVYICPSSEEKQKISRHDPMCTQFMLRALIDLLQKKDGSFGLNSLRISLKGFRSSSTSGYRLPSYPWWNAEREIARSTSIYGVSNLELILRPLLSLRPIQHASIDLGPSPIPDKDLNGFVNYLLTSMTGKIGVSMAREELDDKIEGARDMLEDWLYTLKVKRTSKPFEPAVAEADFMDVDDDSWTSRIDSAASSESQNFDGVYGSSLSADDDGYFDFPGMEAAAPIEPEPQYEAAINSDTNDTVMAEEEAPIDRGFQHGVANNSDTNDTVMAQEEVPSSHSVDEKHSKNAHAIEEADTRKPKRRKLIDRSQPNVSSNTRSATWNMKTRSATRKMNSSTETKQGQDPQGDLCMNDRGHGEAQQYKSEDARALRHSTDTIPEARVVNTALELTEKRGSFQVVVEIHHQETYGKLSKRIERIRRLRRAAKQKHEARMQALTPEEREAKAEKRRQDIEYLVQWYGGWPMPSVKQITRSLDRADAMAQDGKDEEEDETEHDEIKNVGKDDDMQAFAAQERERGVLYRDF